MKRILAIFALHSLILSACNDSANSVARQSAKGNGMTYSVKNISVSIDKPVDEVYHYASNPENFPKWVEFITTMTNQGGVWMGKAGKEDIKIKWTPSNDFGVIDHMVTFPNGETVNNPMRVVPNNRGCEFIFTLFRLPNRTEKEFNEDAKAVERDLQKLKMILEDATESAF